MQKLRRHATLLLSVVLVTGCGGQGQPPAERGTAPSPQSPPATRDSGTGEQAMARAVFERVNAERRARGLAELEWSDQLATVARSYSAEMAQRGELVHQDLRALLQSDRVSGLRSVGENIFTSTGPVPAGAIHVGWMESATHRVNVLNPGFDRLGVGVVCAEDGSVWATQEFGRTVDADRPPLQQETPPPSPIVRPQEDGPTCE